MNVRFREATPQDAPASIELWLSALAARGSPAANNRPRAEQLITARLASPECASIVGESEGKIVAFANASPARADRGAGPVIPGFAHISLVAIAPSLWGAGLGRTLMEHLLAALPSRAFTAAQLWVVPGNLRAVRLYERLGLRRRVKSSRARPASR